MTSTLSSRLTAVLLPAAIFLAAAMPVLAQGQPPLQQQMAPQSPQQTNNVCTRLEAQLAAFERSGPDQARTEQIKKYETAAASNSRRSSTASMHRPRRRAARAADFFSIFSNQSASCGPLNGQIQQMKGNLDRINGDLARLQGSDPAPEREGQRRALLGALAQNDCGPQYRQAAAQPPQRGGLFESLFGAGSVVGNTTVQGENTPAGSGYRTVCVRMCDGYYYPISYSAGPSKFPDDEKTCQASCPAAEAQLFTHRNPGEDINQAVSQGGQLYTAIPNAFKYRQSFDNACTCKGGASQALKGGQDPTVAERRRRGERGARQADVAAARRRAGQADQARNSAAARQARSQGGGHAGRTRRPGNESGRRAGQGDARSEQAGAPGRPDLHRALIRFRNRTLRSSPRRRS